MEISTYRDGGYGAVMNIDRDKNEITFYGELSDLAYIKLYQEIKIAEETLREELAKKGIDIKKL